MLSSGKGDGLLTTIFVASFLGAAVIGLIALAALVFSAAW